jgi:hypothetical protein
MQKEYYKILGLESAASPEQIRRAYLHLAKLYHPDVTGGNSEFAERFKEINEAYHILSIPEKKYVYDLQLKSIFISPPVHFDPYLTASINCRSVLLNEEFEITYRYIGEGRVFHKPECSSMTYLASPVVEHRNIRYGDGEIRETALSYTVCALETGNLTIPPATIYINNRQIISPGLVITVTGNMCFFKKGQQADTHPYPVHLYKEQEVITNYRRTFIYRQMVLIPRSAYAYYYHQVGATLKVIFTILGFLVSILYDFNWIAGLLGGSLTGGAACYSLYFFTGVKPKYYYSLKHKSVVRYMDDGYVPGRDPASGVAAEEFFYFLFRIFR